eukprot:GFKZ01011108.1.p1 GENE.GFKZ01011108.1~~GFKZ01011108.1.p1  ORF type:complete len:1025 (-),score=167.77 GFKZ01011108.1:1391-4372(-)
MADAQVTAWLRHAGLSRLSPRFAAATVSATLFLQLNPSQLEALGVDGPADRKRLTDLITQLRRDCGLESKKHYSKPSAPSAPRANSEIALKRPNLVTAGNEKPAAVRAASFVSAVDRSKVEHSMARVVVCVRKRPLSRREVVAGDRDVVTVQGDVEALCVHELREKVDLTKYVDTHAFQFDRVFSERVGNAMVYERTAKPLVDVLFGGGRATCFAYGQTGAGKTFTMAGDGSENPGLYTLAVKDVFERIRHTESELWRKAEADGIDDFEPPDPVQVWISFYEIYASRLQDLLNRSRKLECREDSNNEVQIVGLRERLCEVEEDVLACIDEGSAARATGVTGANDDSSRSHAIFQITLRNPPQENAENDPSADLKNSMLRNTRSRTAAAAAMAKKGTEIGRLCFIDLAGSERGSDTASSTRQTRMEGAEINKSLLALKECIRAMDQKKDHTPFRGSKLTQVLKASFIGKNCSTVMIANISPASSNVEHTLNTLRYSDRVKEIKKNRVISAPPPGFEIGAVRSTFGSRRATFSHGIGVRAGRNLLGTTPLKTTQRQASFDGKSEDADKYAQPPATERKMSRPQFRNRQNQVTDNDDSRSVLRRTGSLGSPSKRSLTRGKSKGLDTVSTGLPPAQSQPDLGKQRKVREGRTRRRTTRAPSLIPSRPSIVGAAPTRPEHGTSRSSGDESFRTKSETLYPPGSDTSGVTTRSERATRPANNGSTKSKRARLSPQGEVTGLGRRASSPIISSATDASTIAAFPAVSSIPSTPTDTSPHSEFLSPPLAATSSLDLSAGLEPNKDTADTASQRKRGGNATNAARSAMKHYMANKKQQVAEEELLFESSDNLVDEATAAAQERLYKVADEIDEKQSGGAATTSLPPRDPAYGTRNSKRRTTKPDAGTSHPSSSDNSPSSSFSAVDKPEASTSSVAPELKKVLKFHHVQIEELMRLTESDVALVNAAEKGEMDADEYALKLKLNLSQKVDVITALQSKLSLLD